jgi:riboflavin synthase
VFTGIVEAVGTVVAVEPAARLLRFLVEAPALAGGARVGDSVAVRGACLTVTRVEGGRLGFEAVRETLERTALGDLAPGARVNLERPLRADGRLDGHLVQGHVDGVGRVRELRGEGGDVRLFVECPPEVARHLIEKGSVAVDGVSLTVVGVGEGGFDVALIPHTLATTTLGSLRPGDPVNLEADVLAKYVRRTVERILADREGGRGAG